MASTLHKNEVNNMGNNNNSFKTDNKDYRIKESKILEILKEIIIETSQKNKEA